MSFETILAIALILCLKGEWCRDLERFVKRAFKLGKDVSQEVIQAILNQFKTNFEPVIKEFNTIIQEATNGLDAKEKEALLLPQGMTDFDADQVDPEKLSTVRQLIQQSMTSREPMKGFIDARQATVREYFNGRNLGAYHPFSSNYDRNAGHSVIRNAVEAANKLATTNSTETDSRLAKVGKCVKTTLTSVPNFFPHFDKHAFTVAMLDLWITQYSRTLLRLSSSADYAELESYQKVKQSSEIFTQAIQRSELLTSWITQQTNVGGHLFQTIQSISKSFSDLCLQINQELEEEKLGRTKSVLKQTTYKINQGISAVLLRMLDDTASKYRSPINLVNLNRGQLGDQHYTWFSISKKFVFFGPRVEKASVYTQTPDIDSPITQLVLQHLTDKNSTLSLKESLSNFPTLEIQNPELFSNNHKSLTARSLPAIMPEQPSGNLAEIHHASFKLIKQVELFNVAMQQFLKDYHDQPNAMYHNGQHLQWLGILEGLAKHMLSTYSALQETAYAKSFHEQTSYTQLNELRKKTLSGNHVASHRADGKLNVLPDVSVQAGDRGNPLHEELLKLDNGQALSSPVYTERCDLHNDGFFALGETLRDLREGLREDAVKKGITVPNRAEHQLSESDRQFATLFVLHSELYQQIDQHQLHEKLPEVVNALSAVQKLIEKFNEENHQTQNLKHHLIHTFPTETARFFCVKNKVLQFDFSMALKRGDDGIQNLLNQLKEAISHTETEQNDQMVQIDNFSNTIFQKTPQAEPVFVISEADKLAYFKAVYRALYKTDGFFKRSRLDWGTLQNWCSVNQHATNTWCKGSRRKKAFDIVERALKASSGDAAAEQRTDTAASESPGTNNATEGHATPPLKETLFTTLFKETYKTSSASKFFRKARFNGKISQKRLIETVSQTSIEEYGKKVDSRTDIIGTELKTVQVAPSSG